MKVSTLKSRTSRIWVEVPGDGDNTEKIWVDYRPGNLTLEVSEKIRKAGLDSENDAIFVLLENLLAGWDLEDDDGSPLGVKAKDIKKVPLSFIGDVMVKIEEDGRPNPQRDVTSDDG